MTNKKKSKLTPDELLFIKARRIHSLSKKLELDGKEKIDFELSLAVKKYCLITSYTTINKGLKLNGRVFFCQKIKNKLKFLYDMDSLVEDYESNNLSFKKYKDNDPNIYHHLAISYWVSGSYHGNGSNYECCLSALEKYVKKCENENIQFSKEVIEDIVWLFPAPPIGFFLLTNCLLKMVRLKEAAITQTLRADTLFFDEGRKQGIYGEAYLWLEQYKKAVGFLKKGIKYAQVKNKEIPNLEDYYKRIDCDFLKYLYFWSLGMENWLNKKNDLAQEAFENAKKFIKSGCDYYALLMNHLIEALIKGKEVMTMRAQISLLNKLKEKALAKEEFLAKKDKMAEQLSDEITNIITDKITSLDEDIIPSEQVTEGKSGYAKIWTHETTTEGKPISKKEYDKVIENKSKYNIFIIGDKEYGMSTVGKVYFKDIPVFRQPEKKKKGKSKKEKEKKHLTPLEYRILVYTLKKKGKPGEIFNFIEKCWLMPDKAITVKKNWMLISKGEYSSTTFQDDTKLYRVGISKLSTFLNKHLGVDLTTGGYGKYCLSGNLNYCVIEVIPK